MLQMSDSMLAALWTVTPALLTASIMILAVWLLLVAHAGGAARLAQLEVATQKHAYILNELQTSLHTERPPPQQQQQQVHRLAGKVERLDMQLAELCTQVQADDQARELLSRLSGVIADLRTQLQVSIQNSAQVALHSTDIEALKTQLSSCTTDHAELKRQAAVLSQLKRHMDPSTKRQLEMTRQASILDDLKAQLSMSNDLSVELMFSRTSLEEARALMAQALKSQAHHVESAAAGSRSLNQTHPASDQKAGYWLKPKPAQMRHRASVAFPSAEWESPPKRSAELNADITQLGENTLSVSELGDSGAESPSRRSFASSPSMNRVFHRRTSGASAGSSISFLSEWFEHSFRASQGSAPDPALQLPKPSSSDLEATKLADSVNSINPMLWASKQDGLVSPFSLHQPPAGIFEDRGLIASSGPVHACSSPPMPHIPALRFQQKASRLRRCASTGMYEAVSAYAAADTMEEGSSLGRGSSGGSQGRVSRAVSSRGDFINHIYCDMERPVARFVSPFAFQPAGSLHHKDPTMPGLDEGSPPPAPRPPLIRPTTHKQMVHRLSREFQNVEPPSVPSMPAGGRAAEPSEEGVGNTQAVSFSLGSKAGPNLAQQGHVAKQAATSAWDQLLRCQSLEPPTASQLSVTRTQQAMTLIGRTESIRDRTSSK